MTLHAEFDGGNIVVVEERYNNKITGDIKITLSNADTVWNKGEDYVNFLKSYTLTDETAERIFKT